MCPLFSLLVLAVSGAVGASPADTNWYESSFFLLHEDHHTSGEREVGRDADLAQTRRLVGLCRPDVIQIHAKGNPGWTTYPSDIGYTPPKLARDVLGIWRDTARADGYHFSVYYNIGRDGEIMKRHPEWNRSKADGTEWVRALCYHSGVAQAYLWPMVREVMAKYQPDGFWFDGSCFTVRVCYCDACRARFQREQHRDPPKTPQDPGWAEYKEMQRQIYREFVHDTAAMIHRIDPKCLVAVNWAFSLRMPEKPDPEINYLTGDIGNRVEGLSAEAHWYDSQRIPFDLMTQLNTMHKQTMSDGSAAHLRFAPKPKPQIEQEMAVVIANGGRFFLWDSPTPESGLIEDRFQFMKDVVAPFLRARQTWCLGSERVPDVSLLHSATAHYATTQSVTTCFTRPDNRIDGACKALTRLHLNYEMLGDWRLTSDDIQSPLLIVEHPKRLAKSTCSAMIQFVRHGGRLLITGMGFAADRRFSDLFGLSEVNSSHADEPLKADVNGHDLAFRHWLFRVRPSQAEVVMNVSDSEGNRFPLLTRNHFENGEALYAALPLLSSHGRDVVPPEVVRAVLAQAAPPKERWLTTNASDTVELVLRRQPNGYIVHLINEAPGTRDVLKIGTRRYVTITGLPPVPPCHISVKLPQRPAIVRLQPQDQELTDWHYADGRLEASIPEFAVHQMVAIGMSE